eukprot:3852804-Rhodomonas_salina.3
MLVSREGEGERGLRGGVGEEGVRTVESAGGDERGQREMYGRRQTLGSGEKVGHDSQERMTPSRRQAGSLGVVEREEQRRDAMTVQTLGGEGQAEQRLGGSEGKALEGGKKSGEGEQVPDSTYPAAAWAVVEIGNLVVYPFVTAPPAIGKSEGSRPDEESNIQQGNERQQGVGNGGGNAAVSVNEEESVRSVCFRCLRIDRTGQRVFLSTCPAQGWTYRSDDTSHL